MDEKGLIYIVEDEPELREILTEALGHVGYQTQTANDGAALLEILHEKRPDLILMDIGLPDMTGWDLQKKVQEDPAGHGVPVIAVTGYGGAAIEATALKTLKFSDYIRKPYSLSDLMQRIDKVMGPRTAEAEA